MAGARGYDFVVECEFVELCDERCVDLLVRPSNATVEGNGGAAPAVGLEVVEGEEGVHAKGATRIAADNAQQLVQAFNEGRSRRDMNDSDLVGGSAAPYHTRFASLHSRSTLKSLILVSAGQ